MKLPNLSERCYADSSYFRLILFLCLCDLAYKGQERTQSEGPFLNSLWLLLTLPLYFWLLLLSYHRKLQFGSASNFSFFSANFTAFFQQFAPWAVSLLFLWACCASCPWERPFFQPHKDFFMWLISSQEKRSIRPSHVCCMPIICS